MALSFGLYAHLTFPSVSGNQEYLQRKCIPYSPLGLFFQYEKSVGVHRRMNLSEQLQGKSPSIQIKVFQLCCWMWQWCCWCHHFVVFCLFVFSAPEGRHCEVHQMIGNYMWDEKTNVSFDIGVNKESLLPLWWNGSEPLWVTMTKMKKNVSMYYWPG